MTVEETESVAKGLLFDHPTMEESTAWAIACEHYPTEELLDVKRELGLDPEEFIETIKFIEQRGGLEPNRAGDNTKPVDVEGTDGRANTDPKEVADEIEDEN